MKTVKRLVPIVEDGKVIGDMPVEVSEQCAACANWTDAMSCRAFPDGIPEEIVTASHDHSQPFEGDHGIRFEPIEEPA